MGSTIAVLVVFVSCFVILLLFILGISEGSPYHIACRIRQHPDCELAIQKAEIFSRGKPIDFLQVFKKLVFVSFADRW